MSPNVDYTASTGRRKSLTGAQIQHREIAAKAYEMYLSERRTAHEEARIQAEAKISIARERAASAMREAYASGIAIARLGQEVMGTKDYRTVRSFIDIADPLGDVKTSARKLATSTSEKYPGITILPHQIDPAERTDDAPRWRVTVTGRALEEATERARTWWHDSFSEYPDSLILRRGAHGRIELDAEATPGTIAEMVDGRPSVGEHPLVDLLLTKPEMTIRKDIREAFSAAFQVS